MYIPKRPILLLMLLSLCCAVMTYGNVKNPPEVNPYISYENLTADVRDIYSSIAPGFAKMQADETDFYIVKMNGPVLQQWREALEQNGVQVLWYVPHYSYLIKMNRVQAENVKTLPFVYWVGVQQPYFKLSREVRDLLTAPDLSYILIDGKVKATVMVYKGEVSANLRNVITATGSINVVNEIVNPHNTRVIVTFPAAYYAKIIQKLAYVKEVEAIEIFHNMEFSNDAGRWVHQRFVAASFPLYAAGIRGQNQIGGIADSGFGYDSCFFYHSVTPGNPPPFDLQAPWGDVAENPAQRKQLIYYAMDAGTCGAAGTPGANEAGNTHGTHTYGTFIGDNFATACDSGTGDAADGMALCAKVVAEDLGNTLNFVNIPCGSPYDLFNIARTDGARIHTDSWGSPCSPPGNPCGANLYDGQARDVDQFLWDFKDTTVFFAAGNSQLSAPDSTICSPGTAKNGCTIGATARGSSADTLAGFSSYGWTIDKRTKPDFTTQGVGIVSALGDTNNTNYQCTTTSMQGTSMATPAAAGYGLLTRQYYTAGYYPTGVAVPANSIIPSNALMKATMINGSVDMTGVTGTPPNIREGWGRLQLDESLYLTGDARRLWIRDVTPGFTTNQSRCYYVSNSATTLPFKATLVWMDYPGVLYSSPALVNDLRIDVTTPDNLTTYHQRLDASYNIVQTTVVTDPQDNRNNVEQITVSTTPPTGTWKVKVTAVNVPQAPQPFALVVTGNVADVTQPAVPTGTTATASAANQITVSWAAAAGAVSYNLYRSTGACPGGIFTRIASGITVLTYDDTTVSGGTTYSYKVTAVHAASCESDFSNCANATATGICTLGPAFAGATAALNNKTTNCGITVQWAAATSNCSTFPTVSYTIYKSTDPVFVPGPANQLATCQTGTQYLDSNVTVATTYYYVVRSEDSRPGGGGGPCNGGNWEQNVVKVNQAPTGPEVILLTDNAGDVGPVLMTLGTNWQNVTTQNHTPGGTHSFWSNMNANVSCTYLTAPSRTLTGGLYYFLEFWTEYHLEDGWDGSDIQVSSNAGTTYTKITPRQGYTGVTNGSTSACIGINQPLFTGDRLSWAFFDANLAAYAGQAILFRFRYATDDAMQYDGIYYDDIKLSAQATCSTAPPAGNPGDSKNTLYVAKSGTNLNLAWLAPGGTCVPTQYELYRGTLPWTVYNHASVNCAITGLATTTPQDTASYYYLIVPRTATSEGSYGKSSAGTERPQGSSPCTTQNLTAC